MFKVGDLVRYRSEWCSDGEERYIHIVKEVGLLNPVTMQESRVLIETINSGLKAFRPTEIVEAEMMQHCGCNANEYI